MPRGFSRGTRASGHARDTLHGELITQEHSGVSASKNLMTVIDVIALISFTLDVLFAGIAVGRYIESRKNDRHQRK